MSNTGLALEFRKLNALLTEFLAFSLKQGMGDLTDMNRGF
jgi:hypothetical protein